jgi:hypothetical protein
LHLICHSSETCLEYCNYFDPLDANDIARVISNYFLLAEDERSAWIKAAMEHVRKYPGPVERAESYMKIITDSLSVR